MRECDSNGALFHFDTESPVSPLSSFESLVHLLTYNPMIEERLDWRNGMRRIAYEVPNIRRGGTVRLIWSIG